LGIGNRRRNYFSGAGAFVLLNIIIMAAALAVYTVNELLLKQITGNSFIHYHFNDCLAFLILLPYSNILLSLYRSKDITIKNPLVSLFFVIAVGLFWEVVTPIYYKNSTGDFSDLLFYMAGGFSYYMLIPKGRGS